METNTFMQGMVRIHSKVNGRSRWQYASLQIQNNQLQIYDQNSHEILLDLSLNDIKVVIDKTQYQLLNIVLLNSDVIVFSEAPMRTTPSNPIITAALISGVIISVVGIYFLTKQTPITAAAATALAIIGGMLYPRLQNVYADKMLQKQNFSMRIDENYTVVLAQQLQDFGVPIKQIALQ